MIVVCIHGNTANRKRLMVTKNDMFITQSMMGTVVTVDTKEVMS